ncbi:MAG TPA: transporter substrate-binding domain-containing protein [Usitatibacter sp.]|nr:transporter substrate-binding domain-containing protein [Usitatibacter sp.]
MAHSIRWLAFVSIALLLGCAAPAGEPMSAPRDLAPTGRLRVGVVVAKAPTATLVTLDSRRELEGVPVDLGKALAARAGLPLEFKTARNTGELADQLEASEIDVAFLPIDEKRRARLGVGPEYFVLESTYLVRPGAGIGSLADIDRPGMRVAAIRNTATLRALRRMLKEAKIAVVATADDAASLVRTGKADAMAMGRPSLDSIAANIQGSTVLKESFQRTGTAIAIPKGRPLALQYVTRFMEDAKASGEVDRALERVGIRSSGSSPSRQ